MAGQTGGKSKGPDIIKALADVPFVDMTDEQITTLLEEGQVKATPPEPISREQVERTLREQIDKPGYDRRKNPPMHLEYMHQMCAMMVMANLYNSSEGRDAEKAAAVACKAAGALVHEWCKNKEHVPRNKW